MSHLIYPDFVPQTVATQEAIITQLMPDIILSRPDNIDPSDTHVLVIPDFVEMAHHCDPGSHLRSPMHMYGRACLGALAVLQYARKDIECEISTEDIMNMLSISDTTFDAYALCQLKFLHSWYIVYNFLQRSSFTDTAYVIPEYRFALGFYEMLIMMITHPTVALKGTQPMLVSHSVCVHDGDDKQKHQFITLFRNSFLSKTMILPIETGEQNDPCFVPIGILPRG